MPKIDLERRMKTSIASLEREIEELERQKQAVKDRLKRLLAFQSALGEMPPDMLSSILGDELTEGGSSPEPQGTHFERIAKFLLGRNNRGQTIPAIESGTGIPRTSISAVLYRTYQREFVSHDEEKGRGRAKVWCLRDPDRVAREVMTWEDILDGSEGAPPAPGGSAGLGDGARDVPEDNIPF